MIAPSTISAVVVSSTSCLVFLASSASTSTSTATRVVSLPFGRAATVIVVVVVICVGVHGFHLFSFYEAGSRAVRCRSAFFFFVGGASGERRSVGRRPSNGLPLIMDILFDI